MSAYLHHLPGRLRIRCHVLVGNVEAASAVRALLKSQVGVRSAEVSTLTGSVKGHYDPALVEPAAIIGVLHENRYLDGSAESYLTALRNERRTRPHGLGEDRGARMAGKLGGMLARYLLERAIERSLLVLVAKVV